MKSNRFYKYLVLALILLNVGTVTFMWVNRPPHPPKPGEHLLSEQLNIEQKNRSVIDALEKRHHEDKKKLMDRDRELHKKLYDDLGSNDNAEQIVEEINQNKAEIEVMTYEFFNEVATYCNENQMEHLKEIVHNAINQIHPPHPPKK